MAEGAGGFATRQGVETERRMLAIERDGRDRFAPLHGRIQARSIVAAAELRAAELGHAWTQGQRDATRGLLMSPASVTGIQGSAGTAKTTTVLATYAEAARAQGLTVRPLAPTATAAAVLARAIGDEQPMTVAMLLGQDAPEETGPEAWIVDEASMLSARDAARLLDRARQVQARLVLVGDVAQLGSVEAGRAFGQLQDHGMATFVLDEIVRQTNAHTREAVEAMLAGDAAAAFDAIDAGGGTIVEQPDDQTRLAVLAHDFARLSPEDRDRTLVLNPTREGRAALTDAIRAALLRDRQLGEDALVATVLEPCGLTRAEAGQAASYQPGQIVTFRKVAKGQPRPGIGYRVEQVDAETGAVRLIGPQDKAITWHPARWGADQAEAFTEHEAEFRAGDKLQFTRNNYRAHRLNGRVATVVAVDTQNTGLWVEQDDGTRQRLDLAHLADRHVRHGWVCTIHSAQGATAERVIAHLESFRANNVDAAAAYVAISRARSHAAIYTNGRANLTEALGLRDDPQTARSTATMPGSDSAGRAEAMHTLRQLSFASQTLHNEIPKTGR